MKSAGAPGPVTITYTVDATNRIVGILGPWDAFARANGAPGLTLEKVLGTPLFDHIAGPGAEHLVGMLLARARTGRPLSIHFRCDSPSLRRYMRLEMQSQPDDRVRCESIIEREEPRPTQPLFDASVARGDGLVIVCGWCRKVRISPHRWAEVEEAVETLKIFDQPWLPQLSHGICEICTDLVRARAER